MIFIEEFADGIAFIKDDVEIAFYSNIAEHIRFENSNIILVEDFITIARNVENYIKRNDIDYD